MVDEFGFDRHLNEAVFLPLLRGLFRNWFRVEVSGIENLPETGGALIVANHAGVLPFDGLMASVAVHDHHPTNRDLRLLAADMVFDMPVMGQAARKAGPHHGLHRRMRTGCWPPASSPRSSPRATRGSASTSATDTSCSGSAVAGSSRPRCGPARRSCRARSSGPRRSIR